MNDEELAYQNAVQALYPTGNNANVSTMHSFSEPSFWDRASTFGKWAIGNKDFSPIGTLFGVADTAFNFINNRDALKWQKQQHKDNMNLARYNALSDINADLANANMQLLRWQGFNPERANEYAKSMLGSTQDIIKAANSIGIPSDNFTNNLAQLNQLAYNSK